MTGNTALDVAIGLIFVFLLYSLLASIIAEIIASFLGLRARNLRTGIERLLDEDKKGTIPHLGIKIVILDKLIDYVNDLLAVFGTINRKKSDTSTLAKFYNEPAIKYLGNGKFFSKPSYIPASSFSKAIVDILKKGEGATALEKIQNSLATMKEQSEKIVALEAKLKTNPADAATIKKQIAAIKHQAFLHGDTLVLIASFLEDANNDIDQFKVSLENWFETTMDRVSGWYKRKNQFILLVIGLILAYAFNVNTIDIAERLAKDENARTEMVTLATSFVEENPEIIGRLDSVKADTTDASDTTLQQNIAVFNRRLDSLVAIRETLQEDLDQANRVLGLPLPDSLFATRIPRKDRRLVADTIRPNQTFINDSNYIVTFSDKYLAKKARSYYEVDTCMIEQNRPIVARMNCWKYIEANIWGFIITALAVSLGAPFWFDLLSKIVRIRSALPTGEKGNTDKNNTPKQGS